MKLKETLLIVDQDPGRRAKLTHEFLGRSCHVEPCEYIDEYRRTFPVSCKILVHDEGDTTIEVLSAIRDRGTWIPVFAYDVDPQPAKIVQALNRGVVDYLAWPIDVDHLLKHFLDQANRLAAVREVKLREVAALKKLSVLSKREREVVDSVRRGSTNRMIAEELGISCRTVEIHRAKAFRKIGAHSTADAVRMAIDAESPIDLRQDL